MGNGEIVIFEAERQYYQLCPPIDCFILSGTSNSYYQVKNIMTEKSGFGTWFAITILYKTATGRKTGYVKSTPGPTAIRR